MSISTMTPCTIEDGSLPGQEFPCMWNATTEGNGTGYSFVLDEAGGDPHYVTEVGADGTVFTSDYAAAAQVTEIGTAVPDLTPNALAETGVDGHGVLLAVALVLVGALVKRLSKRGAM